MWTVKGRRGMPSESDWEREERRETMRHAVWLVGHGVPVAVAAGECGIGYETLRNAAKGGEERGGGGMSGIDRLRTLAGAWDEWGLGGALMDIADQIERERDAMVADSPYDAITPEDRGAIAWVREHGGLDAVRSEWSSRVPYDTHEQRRQRLLGHIAECETALRRRNERIEELGHRVNDLTRENAELRRRAMPEGMSWPVFEDGEPVKFGDVVSDGDETGRVYYVTFDTVNPVIIGFTDETPDQDPGTWLEVSVNDGERVSRPAPKVLDADGVEIRVGDTVWDVESGTEYEVVGIHADEDTPVRVMRTDGSHLAKAAKPSTLTHRAPVLAADGRPLREGETVWDTKGNGPYIIKKIENDGVVRIEGGDLDYFGFDFTHERPESWERLEEDAKKDTCAYFGVDGGGYGYSECPVKQWKESCDEVKSSDLVRRCRALAERERGQ